MDNFAKVLGKHGYKRHDALSKFLGKEVHTDGKHFVYHNDDQWMHGSSGLTGNDAAGLHSHLKEHKTISKMEKHAPVDIDTVRAADRRLGSQHSEVNDGSLTDVAPADDWGKSNHVSDDVARSIIEEKYGNPAVSQHAEMINTPGGKLAANHSAILAGHGYKKIAHDQFGSEHANGEHVVRITNEGHWMHTKNNKEVNDGHGSQSLYDHLAKVHGKG